MAPVKSFPKIPGTDSDGIPEGMDPHKFYDDRAQRLAAEAVGAERLAYKLFGKEWIKSFAFAIDPFAPFKLSSTRVSVVTRTRGIVSGQQRVRKVRIRNKSVTGSTNADPSTPDLFDRVPYKEVATYTLDTTTVLSSQGIVKGTLKDTTSRTRDVGVRQGEAEFFVPEVHSPPRSRFWVNFDNNTYNFAGGWMNHSRTLSTYQREGQGPTASISNASVAALATAESTLADQMIAKHAIGLLNGCLSQKPTYNLFRSAAELKDLPYTLRQTTKALTSLYHAAEQAARLRYPNVKLKGFHKRVANQYLNEKFGWEATIRDVLGLMVTPGRVAKRVNYLLQRNGQDTSFRSRLRYVEPIASPPAFAYTPFQNEAQVSVGTTGTREVEIRCMTNCNVRLPQIEVPQLRLDLTRKLWGVDPTPVDLYNLVPWSWLVDWFTGFGDYVEAFHNINNDKSVLNFGLITYLSRGEIKTNFVGRATSSYTTVSQNVTVGPITKTSDVSHTSTLLYRYRKRKNITGSYHVKPTWDLPSFSGFQLAILGALLAVRS